MNLPKYLLDLPVRADGHYLVVTRSQHWGRGPTLLAACEMAKKAGARSLAAPNVAVSWQPDSSWQEHAVRYPDKAAEVEPLRVGNDGMFYWWGAVRPEILHSPKG